MLVVLFRQMTDAFARRSVTVLGFESLSTVVNMISWSNCHFLRKVLTSAIFSRSVIFKKCAISLRTQQQPPIHFAEYIFSVYVCLYSIQIYTRKSLSLSVLSVYTFNNNITTAIFILNFGINLQHIFFSPPFFQSFFSQLTLRRVQRQCAQIRQREFGEHGFGRESCGRLGC